MADVLAELANLLRRLLGETIELIWRGRGHQGCAGRRTGHRRHLHLGLYPGIGRP